MSLLIKVIPASYGDSIIISFGQETRKNNILIDGGLGRTYLKYLKKEIELISQRGEFIDLLIITHIDEDHIGGIIRLFEDTDLDKNIIKKVWYNSGITLSKYFDGAIVEDREIQIIDRNNVYQSVRQGLTLEKELLGLGIWELELITSAKDSPIDLYGSKITILSPEISDLKKLHEKWELEKNNVVNTSSISDYQYSIDELLDNKFDEDASIPNQSSIAFLFEFDNKSILLLSDSTPSVIINSLHKNGYNNENKLNVDVVKLSHHGSKKNTNSDLLDIIGCSNFIVSSDSKRHSLPHKECLTRVITAIDSPTIYFNYDLFSRNKIFSKEDMEKYSFICKLIPENTFEKINGGILLWR